MFIDVVYPDLIWTLVENTMRLATWNINGMRARLDYLLLWLNEVRPDVVGLQELKMTDELFPHDALREAGYRAVTHGQKSWNGVAILERITGDGPATASQVGLPGQEELGARLITLDVAGLSFTTVYCPNGKTLQHDDYGRKLLWFDALFEHFRQRHQPDMPVVLCGDFNIVPAAIDSWNERGFRGGIFHSDDERTRLARFVDWGFVDTFRRQHPDVPGFSWWDYRGGAFHRKQGLRIDLILATGSVADKLQGAFVERKWRKKTKGLTASDHAPVWIDIDWPRE